MSFPRRTFIRKTKYSAHVIHFNVYKGLLHVQTVEGLVLRHHMEVINVCWSIIY